MLITTSSDLAAVCARLARHPFVTVVLGYGDSISSDQLVQRTNGTQLDKTSRSPTGRSVR